MHKLYIPNFDCVEECAFLGFLGEKQNQYDQFMYTHCKVKYTYSKSDMQQMNSFQ